MIAPNGEYEQCPYDISHTILKSRFQVHLVRCRKNHKKVQMVTCPFNNSHILHQPELDWHVKTCPNRAYFEHFRHHQGESEEEKSRISSTPPPVCELPSEENWDDLPPEPSYDPQSYAANAPILRTLKGHSKSVKKDFRAAERSRLLQLNNTQPKDRKNS
ncbi:gametocyte-specific factor 1 homolog [Ceratitis capitata]|uniref:Gametocyte-specific factor 1 n=1 Tax=Ceratitis capitata TaxID=7213 RepID=W8B2S8_CERCA|nr:gametocyte-specific factor 1 homolog [Ceratitis capitata]